MRLIWPLLALVWCAPLCYGRIFFALLWIVTNSDSESSNKQSLRRTAGSTTEQRKRGLPAESSPAFLKTGEDECGRGELERERERERERNVWVVDHLPIFSAAVQQDGPQVHKRVNKYMSVSFISCQTHGEYIVVRKNAGWCHSKQSERWFLYIFFQLHTQSLTY